jgi:hypothetical protein
MPTSPKSLINPTSGKTYPNSEKSGSYLGPNPKVHFIGRLDGLQLAPTPCPATLQEATACLANHLLETASVPSFLSNENFLLENGRAPFVGQM